MKEILQYLFDHQLLSKAQAQATLTEIALGKFNENEVTAFVSVFLMRNISLPELEGFQRALLDLAKPIDLGTRDLVDIVGTGGDGKNTFNISTLASFLVAGCGQKVAKHGNYGVSSISGASNVLEELGYRFKSEESELLEDLNRAGICFLHAPLFHPALKTVAPLRRNLGTRTFFNILGPLVNPAHPNYSLIGVYNREIARIYQYILQTQKEKFTLVHALDGYDEISLTDETKIYSEEGEEIISPEGFGFEVVKPKEISGGKTKKEAALKFLNILKGRGTRAENSVAIVNAAMALKTTGKYGDYKNCLALATNSLVTGKAYACFQKLIQE